MKDTSFARLNLALAVACLGVCVFVPLVVISWGHAGSLELSTRASGEVAVGIAVILRATARRWLRASSRHLLRSTVGAYSRASARTITRRAVKYSGRLLAGLLIKDRSKLAAGQDAEQDSPPGQNCLQSAGSLLLGFLALSLSFRGVLARQTPADLVELTQHGQLSLTLASLLGGAPLLVYAAVATLAGRIGGVRVRFQTAPDGLLIQGYFTGAGSFLPMTTDVEYSGNERRHAWVAGVTLGTLYTTHLLLGLAAHATGAYVFLFAGTMFLTYCFVFSFPIRPFEGYHLWARSRWLWLIFWLPILASFIGTLPASFAALL